MIPDNRKIRIAFSVTNCICFDQRVLKMAGVLAGMNADITIIGRKKGSCCEKNIVPFKTKRFRMIFRKGFLFYKFFNIRLLFWLLFHKYNLLVANDLDTLLPNFIVSKIRHIPLVYDSHEYFTGLPEIKERPFVKFVWKSVEKTVFPYLKYVMTVSEPIASLYEEEYGLRPVVIRNYPESSAEIKAFTKKELNIPDTDFLLIIQGTGINLDKGGEELVDAIASAGNISLIVAGSGDMVPALKQRAEKHGIDLKVKFIPPLPWKELMRYTKSADAGMVLEKNTNLNYRYSLPNKLFDYISAGIPVIASDLPETKKIITTFSCGIIIPEVTPEEIIEAVNMLSGNKLLHDELRRNSISAAGELNWEKESVRVRNFYENIMGKEQE